MKKRLFAVLMAATMVASLVACGSTEPATTEPATEEAAPATEEAAPATENAEAPATETSSDLKIAMITDSGDITDMSFNQTTYEACDAFSKANGLTFQYYKPSEDSDEARTAAFNNAVADGYNVVLSKGIVLYGGTDITAEIVKNIK